MTPIATTVIRHPRERISKCSLRFLHDRQEMTFHKATVGFRFCATGFTMLAVSAPELSPADAGRPLLLLDSTWRWLPQLTACLDGEPVRRSIPGNVETAGQPYNALFSGLFQNQCPFTRPTA